MTKLKNLKNELINRKAWIQYKHAFKHKQIKFIYSKVILIFNPECSNEELIKHEFDMLKSSKTDGVEMFVNVFADAEIMTNQKANWDEFARFLFFAYQTSTYWKDVKKKIHNIYTSENYIKMNEQKRKHFYNWLHSIDTNIDQYNAKIMSTMQKVF